jgi:hypothetical protein
VRLQVRRACVAGVIGLAAIALADPDTKVAHIARVLRYGLVFPAMLPALWATFTAVPTFRRFGPVLIDVGCVAVLAGSPMLNVAVLSSVPTSSNTRSSARSGRSPSHSSETSSPRRSPSAPSSIRRTPPTGSARCRSCSRTAPRPGARRRHP